MARRDLLLPAFLILLAACGQEAPKTEAPPPPPAPTATVADVLGDWAVEPVCMSNMAFNMIKKQLEDRGRHFSDAEIDEALQPVLKDWQVTPPVFTFKDDKSLDVKTGKDIHKATWSLEGDTVTVNWDDNPENRVQFTVMPGYLSNVTTQEGRRPIHLIRK
jgi:hypothetical protein